MISREEYDRQMQNLQALIEKWGALTPAQQKGADQIIVQLKQLLEKHRVDNNQGEKNLVG